MESKACDGASAGCTGTSPHNASPKAVTVLRTNLYCLLFTILHLCAGKIPSWWAQHSTCKASSSNFYTTKRITFMFPWVGLHLLREWELEQITSRLRDLVWMHREFLSCSGREELKNGEQHLGAVDSANSTTQKVEQLQGCAQHKTGRETLYPNPPMLLSQKSGENKTPELQMRKSYITYTSSLHHVLDIHPNTAH